MGVFPVPQAVDTHLSLTYQQVAITLGYRHPREHLYAHAAADGQGGHLVRVEEDSLPLAGSVSRC
jgi:hypothetical protein